MRLVAVVYLVVQDSLRALDNGIHLLLGPRARPIQDLAQLLQLALNFFFRGFLEFFDLLQVFIY